VEWLASNLDSPDGFTAYRTRGASVTVASRVTPLTPSALPPTATSYVDLEELPDGIDFTYWTKAVFIGEETGPSIFATVRAVNQAPVAVADSYPLSGGSITANLFGNDTDADMGPAGKSRWTAVLVNASGVPIAPPPGLTFPGNGSFTYLAVNGPLTFYYRIVTGTWSDGGSAVGMSPDSNVAPVTILPPGPPLPK